MKISATTWNTISKLLDEALDLEPAARTTWLERLQISDPEIASSLQQLLTAHATSETADVLASLPSIDNLTATSSEQKGQLGLSAGDRVGPYLLKRELGAGGMADVWLAERADGAFARDVALKLPRINRLRKDLAIRFARERDILARLEHPHIARLYDAGVTGDGLPYLAMEFVDGVPITDYCDTQRMPIKARLELFAQVLDAVQFAHANLIIHRDLKPSNIIVGNDGRVRLLDFGIAKLLTDDESIAETQLTQLSGRALTPDYASPEQIRGEPLSTASDVYSLGVILYELLTGKRPYRLKLATPAQLEQAIIDSDPTPPSARILQEASKEDRREARRRVKVLEGDLDTITMKALQKKTVSRYTTAAELSAELKRYLKFEPIQAKPESTWYAFGKFVRRNRVPVAGAVALVASLGAGLIGTLWQADRAEKAAERATAEAQRAAAINDFLGETFLSNTIYQADSGASQQKRAVDLLNEAAEKIKTRLLDQPAARNRLLYQFAEIFNGHGDFGRAENIAKMLLEANQQEETVAQRKDRFDAGLLLANIYNGSRRYEEQLKVVRLIEPYISEIGKTNPESVSDYYYIRGLALHETGNVTGLKDLEAGVEGNRRYAKNSPNRRNDYTVRAGRLASVYMRIGRYPEADAVLREAIEFFTPYIDSSPAVYAFLHTIKARNHATAGHFAASEKAQAISRQYYQRVNLPDNAGWRNVNAAQSRIESALGNWQASEAMAVDALGRYPERDHGLDAYTIERIGLGLARARGGEWIKHCDAMNAVFKEVETKPVHRVVIRDLAAYVVARCASPALTASQHDFARSLVNHLDALKDNTAASPNPIESIPRNIALSAVDLLDAKPQTAYDRLSAFLATRATSAYKSHPMWHDVAPWLGVAASALGKHVECIAVTQSALAEIEADEEIKQSRPLFVPLLQILAQCQMQAGDRKSAATTIDRAIRLQEKIESPTGQSMQHSKSIAAAIAAR